MVHYDLERDCALTSIVAADMVADVEKKTSRTESVNTDSETKTTAEKRLSKTDQVNSIETIVVQRDVTH